MDDSAIFNLPTDVAVGDAAGSADAQRRGDRDSLLVLARLTLEGGERTETVRVRNVSSGGLMAQASDAFRPGARVQVGMDAIGSIGAVVAWAEAGRIGIAFDHPIDKARARKPRAEPAEVFRHTMTDHRRPPVATR